MGEEGPGGGGGEARPCRSVQGGSKVTASLWGLYGGCDVDAPHGTEDIVRLTLIIKNSLQTHFKYPYFNVGLGLILNLV